MSGIEEKNRPEIKKGCLSAAPRNRSSVFAVRTLCNPSDYCFYLLLLFIVKACFNKPI